MYRAVAGVAGKSYGMNVARLAGLPARVVDTAERVATVIERRR
jgi:DNA mismatch repair ATPase MutS